MIRMAILTVHFSHIRCERAQPYMVQSRIYIYIGVMVALASNCRFMCVMRVM